MAARRSPHRDRNAQFDHIDATAARFLRQGCAAISVESKKKKELVGEFKSADRRVSLPRLAASPSHAAMNGLMFAA
jgi:Rhodopirellula transposase DDE domain